MSETKPNNTEPDRVVQPPKSRCKHLVNPDGFMAAAYLMLQATGCCPACAEERKAEEREAAQNAGKVQP